MKERFHQQKQDKIKLELMFLIQKTLFLPFRQLT